jgi:hypothetical protein
MHAVLRRKARCDAAGENVSTVSVEDLSDEVARFKQASGRLSVARSGTYV